LRSRGEIRNKSRKTLLKYYYPQHIKGYARIKAEGKVAWGEIHGAKSFEDFSARSFLESVLPTLQFDTPRPEVFNYGCGTGPDACYLAERGFHVDAVDLIPDAIEIAKQQAALRNLDINYTVQDICDVSPRGKQYDIVLDSFCLQCIVFDKERQNILSAVYTRLKPRGYYLVASAVMDTEHLSLVREGETVTDSTTGTVYTGYGGGKALLDRKSGIVLIPIDDSEISGPNILDVFSFPDARQINGRWFLPHRRHITREQLENELQQSGFKVIYHDVQQEGCLVCVKSG
jgi:2-polyprenyl-3-methyl-5-hydroxy-6-metoxy-1,4-benzoquinol methylase